MTNQPFPAYAKSAHPDVVEAVEETYHRHKTFLDKARQLCEELVSDPSAGYYHGWYFADCRMTGISTQAAEGHALPGQWKKPTRGVLKPFKNNPIAERMAAIQYKAKEIPGRGNVFMGDGYMGTGQIFLHNEVVYSHINFGLDPMTDKEQASAAEFGWTEILASEWHSAREAFQSLKGGEQQ
ncbi:hypothetical protein [Zhihengliuella flava]|uniref:Uncharacterized protein n=1 Tax=Zhihengliuella flava TaxID=1285193 RepID=A0A931DAR9_9MICC|nr:hypothetical protein [Zhihengliuella flava]MBG6083265.1 hypothetical protein [Zhihengliuella flava]